MGPRRHVLTIIGDLGVDLVLGPIAEWPRIGTETLVERSELRAGGSAGNTALALNYLGAHSRLVSIVGNDDFGRWLSEQFRELDASLTVCDAPTTVSVGVLDACGERTFLTTRGHLERFSVEHVLPKLTRARPPNVIAHLSGVFLTPTLRSAYGRLIAELRGLGYQVSLDTGWPPHDWNPSLRAEVAGWIDGCDHVLLNELEVSTLADTPDLDEAIRRVSGMLKPGATLVTKTGPRGAIGWQNGQTIACAADRVAIFDTIGAGDAFNAGYLLARLEGYPLEPAVAAGCGAATSIIARFPRRSIESGEFASRIALPPTLRLARP